MSKYFKETTKAKYNFTTTTNTALGDMLKHINTPKDLKDAIRLELASRGIINTTVYPTA